MRESGEPMEFGIFDFYKVFSRAFGEGIGRQEGVRMGGGGCGNPDQRSKCIITMLMVLIFLSVYLLSLLVFSSRIKNTLEGTLSVA